jgi:hypothetical protein
MSARLILAVASLVGAAVVAPGVISAERRCTNVTVWTSRATSYTAQQCLDVPDAPAPAPAPRPAASGGQGISGCTHTPGPSLDGDFTSDDGAFFRVHEGARQMQWVRRCPGATGTTYWANVDGDPAAPTAEPVFTSASLLPDVFDSVRRELPTPVPVIAPADRNPDGYAYVQFNTYFWVEQREGQWATVSATSSVPGLSLTVTAEPVRMLVDTGDGGSVNCPGTPPALLPNSSPVGFRGCGYVYRNSSATAPNGQTFPVTVTVEWQVTWVASNGEAGDLGVLATTSAPRDLPVAEIQAVVTG